MRLAIFLKKNSQQQQEELNLIMQEVAKLASPTAGADESLSLLENEIEKTYQIKKLTLAQLIQYKNQLDKLPEVSGSDVDAYNNVSFRGVLALRVEEQIKIKQIEQCKLLCTAYMESLQKEMPSLKKEMPSLKKEMPSLKKDKVLSWNEKVSVAVINEEGVKIVGDTQLKDREKYVFLKLTKEKYKIIKAAIKVLENDKPNEEKLADFKTILKDNEATLSAVRIDSKNEKYKQISTLFLINIYRVLFGTKGSQLVKEAEKMGIKERFSEQKDRLIRQKSEDCAVTSSKTSESEGGLKAPRQ
ncbi:MAG: hypothetical protein CK426_03485 [Legionella sp.]|nr:MAG: hypothetical protein CK423_09185 [Legionella sp.]PJD99175.1 MAG: hypothetical protein CK426_03485 [Legionella sp.]